MPCCRFSIFYMAIIVCVLFWASTMQAYSLKEVMNLNQATLQEPFLSSQPAEEVYFAEKRAGTCPPWKPFQCPEGTCIPLKYLCDYNVDCAESGYDENKKMCTAALRPTVESTEEFLNYQLNTLGDDYFVKLFGPRAANRLAGLGGVSVVAVALTESPRIIDFANSMSLTATETKHLHKIFKLISEKDNAGLASLDFKESEVEGLQPVVEQLVDTGFLKFE